MAVGDGQGDREESCDRWRAGHLHTHEELQPPPTSPRNQMSSITDTGQLPDGLFCHFSQLEARASPRARKRQRQNKERNRETRSERERGTDRDTEREREDWERRRAARAAGEKCSHKETHAGENRLSKK